MATPPEQIPSFNPDELIRGFQAAYQSLIMHPPDLVIVSPNTTDAANPYEGSSSARFSEEELAWLLPLALHQAVTVISLDPHQSPLYKVDYPSSGISGSRRIWSAAAPLQRAVGTIAGVNFRNNTLVIRGQRFSDQGLVETSVVRAGGPGAEPKAIIAITRRRPSWRDYKPKRS